MLYKKCKRERIGNCRICSSKNVELSWDHVPPKGAIELTEVEIRNIVNAFVRGAVNQRPEFSQNGLKLRTICADCNSLLGKAYDPALIDFSLAMSRVLRSRLTFPEILHIRGQPNLIAKSIFGHLMAANLTGEDDGFDSAMRPVVLDVDHPIPEDIHIFYWIHPYDHQVTLPNFVMPAVKGRFDKPGTFSVLKFFPLGFAVSDQSEYLDLQELTRWTSEQASVERDLLVRLSEHSDNPFWPEWPGDNGYLVPGASAYHAVAANPRMMKVKHG